jgi:hypothetical protein
VVLRRPEDKGGKWLLQEACSLLTKRTKDFYLLRRLLDAGYAGNVRLVQEAKVFWFFFSKKTCFLPFAAKPTAACASFSSRPRV